MLCGPLQVKQVESGTVHFQYSLSSDAHLDTPAGHPRLERRPSGKTAAPPSGKRWRGAASSSPGSHLSPGKGAQCGAEALTGPWTRGRGLKRVAQLCSRRGAAVETTSARPALGPALPPPVSSAAGRS